MNLLKPYRLNQGDTIGVFTPSMPAYDVNEELFTNGVSNLESLGFKVKLGQLTANRSSQGYRSGTPQERAQEFMELIHDPNVQALIATIGGNNSSSMLPYLDFNAIRAARKIICGYSDVTSLHLGILQFSGLKTLYGPAVMTWFGEYPDGVPESVDSFLLAVTTTKNNDRVIQPFSHWSNHRRDWNNGDWKNILREWQTNTGWHCLNSGCVTAEIVVFNLNTALCFAGTKYFPDLNNCILVIEEMYAPFSRLERNLRHLELMGVFDIISGLVFGKVEILDSENAVFSLEDLLLEVVGERAYPIVSNFDTAHTLPMHTLGQRANVTLTAQDTNTVTFTIHESFVE